MSGLFYNLGRKVGPHYRKAKWMWHSLTGNKEDLIKIEYEVGIDLAGEVRRQLECDNDQASTELLEKISHKLKACLTNKLRKFNFEAALSNTSNAFALPGGFIFITRGIMELCEWNEDEIAFILAHEMGHVIRGHAINRIINKSAISIASKATPIKGKFSGWLKQVGIKALESAYSQNLEYEADEFGTRLIIAAGYDKQAPITSLTRLGKLKENGEQKGLGAYFSTHPQINERIEHIKSIIN